MVNLAKKKRRTTPYPYNINTLLYEAIKQVARERSAKLKRPVSAKDVIDVALLSDPQVAKCYGEFQRKEKS